MLRLFLERVSGVVVVGDAANGREAIRLAAELRPDFVLIDVGMPVVDGLTATHLMLKTDPAVRVITLSGDADPGLASRARKAGAAHHLTKPFDLHLLARILTGGYKEVDFAERPAQAALSPGSGLGRGRQGGA